MSSRALVLGGGGVSGIGWETGMIAGLAERGIELRTANRIIGTSAGSSVAAKLTSGISPEDAYAAQLADPGTELPAKIGLRNILGLLGPQLMPGDDAAIARRIGRAALRATTVPEAERRAVIAARVGGSGWPQAKLLITALDAQSGVRRVFDKDSGVSLADAVAASCAVPTVWPPVTIGASRYIDGGSLSATNTDLAAGCTTVLVLAPIAFALRKRWSVAGQLAALGTGVHWLVLSPDAAAKRAMGRNSLDPAVRAASAKAGRAQASTVADAVGSLWGWAAV
ncbi:MAG: patatin-like phospholipase family protein [Specibacter sp.]